MPDLSPPDKAVEWENREHKWTLLEKGRFGLAAKVRLALVLGCDLADEDRVLSAVWLKEQEATEITEAGSCRRCRVSVSSVSSC